MNAEDPHMPKIISPRRRNERGQTLVLMALSIVALLAAAALVIDGGNAYAQQRRAQNGMDASAEAGAAQLARKLSGVAITDADVLAAVQATRNANEITTLDSADYTDRDGTVLATVGGGVIPANAQGVKAVGSRVFDTYLAGVVGMNQWTATTDATAITGYASETGFGGLIPLTIPILLTQCEAGGGSSKLYFPDDNVSTTTPYNPPFGTPWPIGPNNRVAIPLCSNGPGNIGWIDWEAPNGGASEIAAAIGGANNPPVQTPHWYEITQTGGLTSLDNDMDKWEGQDITIPIFHAEADNPITPLNEELKGTCTAAPNAPRTALGDCPPPDVGTNNGNGWYFLVTLATFHLEHAYIQENNQAECNDPSLVSPVSPLGTGPLNKCLIGYFKAAVVAANMTAGSMTPTSAFSPLAIQLIN